MKPQETNKHDNIIISRKSTKQSKLVASKELSQILSSDPFFLDRSTTRRCSKPPQEELPSFSSWLASAWETFGLSSDKKQAQASLARQASKRASQARKQAQIGERPPFEEENNNSLLSRENSYPIS